MTNAIVSVRIPESLVRELREQIKKEHYLDLSEAVRGIVRKRWMEWRDPTAFQIKKLRREIKEVIHERSQKTKKEELLDELQRIRKMIVDKEVEK